MRRKNLVARTSSLASSGYIPIWDRVKRICSSIRSTVNTLELVRSFVVTLVIQIVGRVESLEVEIIGALNADQRRGVGGLLALIRSGGTKEVLRIL